MRKILISILCVFLSVSISLSEKNDIVGSTTKEEILRLFPEWTEVVKTYTPDPEIISRLKNINHNVTIEVYLATWCPDSKTHVSAYFKIMDSVDNPLIFSTYTGLPRDKQAREPYTKGKDIIRIPTFIILADGMEKGRIVEHPIDSLERDLSDILSVTELSGDFEFCQSNYHADLPINCIDCH